MTAFLQPKRLHVNVGRESLVTKRIKITAGKDAASKIYRTQRWTHTDGPRTVGDPKLDTDR